MSLSTWLRDYLYIPLGGSRGGAADTQRNLMLTMLLGGLWHGANWTFVAWGGYHGLLLALERTVGVGRGADPRGAMRFLRIGFTFILVLFGWVLFRARSFGEAFDVVKAMLIGGGGSWSLITWPFLPLAIALVVGIAQESGAAWNWRQRSGAVQAGAFACMLLAIEMCSWPGPAMPFVYFKF